MIPHGDLIGRRYDPGGFDPSEGPLCCSGVVLALLERHGIPLGDPPSEAPRGTPLDRLGASVLDSGPPRPSEAGIAPDAPQGASGAAQRAERVLAAWATADRSPWTRLEDGYGAAGPEDGDVLLLDVDGSPTGLGVVVDAAAQLVVTSLHKRGVVALRLRVLAPTVLEVYRWNEPRVRA